MKQLTFATLLVGAAIAALVFLSHRDADRARPSTAPAGVAQHDARATSPDEPAAANRVERRAVAAQPAGLPAHAEESAPPQTAAEERAMLHDRLGRSGDAAGAWAGDAHVAIETVAAELRGLGVTAGDAECFADGCIVALAYPDLNAFDEAGPIFADHAALQPWSRAVTGPETDDAGVASALVLFRPEPDDVTVAHN